MRYKPTTLAAFLVVVLSLAISVRAAEIPLGESGGIYTVPVQINRSVTLQFLVDPGSAVVVIPRSVLNSLVLNGTLTQDDVVGTGIAELADRSLYRAVRLRLRELRVGDQIVRDVIAAVAPALSQPLLGQSFLGRFSSVTFDNQRRLLILPGPGSAPVPQYPTTAFPTPFYPPAPAAPPSVYGQPSYWPPAR
jgi:predicted aspartyl protease